MTEQRKMTKAERTELGQLIRKRERVMKAAAAERSAHLLAEVERNLAAVYAFDDDAVWQKATEAAQKAVREARQTIIDRCGELGIPAEFAPGLNLGWYGRGQNASASRRAELRKVAQSRIAAMEREAKTKIERLSLEAQTEVIANGLETDAARAFLEKVSTVDDLMPSLDVQEIKSLVDARSEKAERERWMD